MTDEEFEIEKNWQMAYSEGQTDAWSGYYVNTYNPDYEKELHEAYEAGWHFGIALTGND